MNSKKLFAILLLLVMITCLFSGCDYSAGSFEKKPDPIATVVPTKAPPTVSTFVEINSKKIIGEITQYIVYDPETMVMYSVLYQDDSWSGGGRGIGISQSPMYNPDGTLRIYNPNAE